MSDHYTPQTPMAVRPSIAGIGPDPHRAAFQADFRTDPIPARQSRDGGFSSGILVAIVFIVVAIIAAVVFSNRDMFGIGLGVTPASAPVATTIDPIAPTPAPAPEPDLPVPGPATPPAPTP